MPNDAISAENDASRAELEELATGLDAASYNRSASGGRTVSTILCHIAFWDQRALFLLKQWQRKGAVDTLRLDPESIDSINNAVNAIVLEVAGSEATTLVLKSAAAVDAFIAGVSEELAQKIREAGFERYLRRSLHRREHIQKIRELLGVRNV